MHLAVLPGDISDAREFNDSGRQQIGPTDPATIPIYEAVEKYTEPGAAVAYFRARTMSLLTDRLAFQTTSLPRIRQRADYFAQQRGSEYFQPAATEFELVADGFEEVWSNERWILWRVPDHPLTQARAAGGRGRILTRDARHRTDDAPRTDTRPARLDMRALRELLDVRRAMMTAARALAALRRALATALGIIELRGRFAFLDAAPTVSGRWRIVAASSRAAPRLRGG